jgi:hypothetical protein
MEFSDRVLSVAAVITTSRVSDVPLVKGTAGTVESRGTPWIGPYLVWYQTDQISFRGFGACPESAEGAKAPRATTATSHVTGQVNDCLCSLLMLLSLIPKNWVEGFPDQAVAEEAPIVTG